MFTKTKAFQGRDCLGRMAGCNAEAETVLGTWVIALQRLYKGVLRQRRGCPLYGQPSQATCSIGMQGHAGEHVSRQAGRQAVGCKEAGKPTYVKQWLKHTP